jgi:outer membrane protein TolC
VFHAPDSRLGHIKGAGELAFAVVDYRKRGQWPDTQWWLRYHDSQLDSLMANALASAPTLKVAEARLRNAAGIAEQIGAVRSVQLGAAASASKDKVSYATISCRHTAGTITVR